VEAAVTGTRPLVWLVTAVAAGAAMAYAGHHHHADPPARGTTTAALSAYVNPLAGERWTLARTDQGVDYYPAVPEPVRAIGAGVVVYSSTDFCPPSGWPGCGVIGYKLTAGPEAGGVIYVAEHIDNLLPKGATFRAGSTLATALPGYPWTEWGWANCQGNGPAVTYHGAADGTPMAGGLAFARFMRELGASTAMNPGPGPDVVRGC
jgi:hypothetical protein